MSKVLSVVEMDWMLWDRDAVGIGCRSEFGGALWWVVVRVGLRIGFAKG